MKKATLLLVSVIAVAAVISFVVSHNKKAATTAVGGAQEIFALEESSFENEAETSESADDESTKGNAEVKASARATTRKVTPKTSKAATVAQVSSFSVQVEAAATEATSKKQPVTLEPVTVLITEPTVKEQSNDGQTEAVSSVAAPTSYRPGGEVSSKAEQSTVPPVVGHSNVVVEIETEPAPTIKVPETSTARSEEPTASVQQVEEDTSIPATSHVADESAPHEHREEMRGGILYVYCENVTATYREGNTVYKPF